MGELYCCSNQHRLKSLDEENSDLIGKLNFSKKYIIGAGGFSKVSLNFYYFKFLIFYFRFGKSNLRKIKNFML